MERWLVKTKSRPIEDELAEYCTEQIIPCTKCKGATPNHATKDAFLWNESVMRFDEHKVCGKVAFIAMKPTWNKFGKDYFDNTFVAMWKVMFGALVVDWIVCRGRTGSEKKQEIQNCLPPLKINYELPDRRHLF